MAPAGLAVVLAAVTAYLILTFGLRRTYPTWWFDLAVASGTTLAVVGWIAGGAAWMALAAIVLEIAWFVLTRWEMRLPGAGRLSVDVGDQIPPFTATTAAGAGFTERDLAAAAPALLVLYRGWWCPYCTTQLDALTEEHQTLRDAGLTVFAISVDTLKETAGLEERYGGIVTFLSDPDGAFLDTLGVRDTRGAPWYDRLLFGAAKQNIAMPGALVVDDTGRIVFSYRSPRIDIRARPQEIIDSMER
jgi:peroxiredoxin